ncbi:hypothetical protein GW915_06405 [bacterium]|nr:hypothetical protein [bacterium]
MKRYLNIKKLITLTFLITLVHSQAMAMEYVHPANVTEIRFLEYKNTQDVVLEVSALLENSCQEWAQLEVLKNVEEEGGASLHVLRAMVFDEANVACLMVTKNIYKTVELRNLKPGVHFVQAQDKNGKVITLSFEL